VTHPPGTEKYKGSVFMEQNGRPKKPLYKKWWFWVIVILLLGSISSTMNGGNKKEAKAIEDVSTYAASLAASRVTFLHAAGLTEEEVNSLAGVDSE